MTVDVFCRSLVERDGFGCCYSLGCLPCSASFERVNALKQQLAVLSGRFTSFGQGNIGQWPKSHFVLQAIFAATTVISENPGCPPSAIRAVTDHEIEASPIGMASGL